MRRTVQLIIYPPPTTCDACAGPPREGGETESTIPDPTTGKQNPISCLLAKLPNNSYDFANN